MQRVLVQSDTFDVETEYRRLVGEYPGSAVVTFAGYVRDHCDSGAVVALELEHYPEMTESILESLGQQAEIRFGLRAWRIVHRFGTLSRSDPIVWVGVVAEHRTEAFQGCQFIMDTLKTDAPFWKREHLADGSACWVASQYQDEQRRAQWYQQQEEE
jgi:molybdopterin synthase catalytic subunit